MACEKSQNTIALHLYRFFKRSVVSTVKRNLWSLLQNDLPMKSTTAQKKFFTWIFQIHGWKIDVLCILRGSRSKDAPWALTLATLTLAALTLATLSTISIIFTIHTLSWLHTLPWLAASLARLWESSDVRVRVWIRVWVWARWRWRIVSGAYCFRGTDKISLPGNEDKQIGWKVVRYILQK